MVTVVIPTALRPSLTATHSPFHSMAEQKAARAKQAPSSPSAARGGQADVSRDVPLSTLVGLRASICSCRPFVALQVGLDDLINTLENGDFLGQLSSPRRTRGGTSAGAPEMLRPRLCCASPHRVSILFQLLVRPGARGARGRAAQPRHSSRRVHDTVCAVRRFRPAPRQQGLSSM